MLLNHAREQGVQVHEGARVREVLFEGERAVGIRVDLDGPTEMHAQVVVDASGQSSMIMDRLRLREWDKVLKKAALWTYWKGALRESGLDEGGTIVMQLKDKKGWFWYIPLHDDVVSVGVVASHDYLFKERDTKDFEKIYFEEVERCPGVKSRIASATRICEFRAQKEYSYRATKVAGNGWVLVGDAYGFLDPLYSSGIMLALTSAELAADAIAEALRVEDPSEERLRIWETKYVRAMDRMRRLVCAFYDGLNFGKLVRKHPEKKHLITDVLVGDLFKDEIDELWPLLEQV
jgi:flavin-dependent dehydrogenase